jgi:DNA-binding MarR family transcriptional regulator
MEEAAKKDELNQAIETFWETVPAVWNLIRGHIRAIAAEQFAISVEQFHVLRLIRRGLTSVRELAEARGISNPAVSQAADSLVEKGLITRREAAEDRRFVCLELTPAGEQLLEQIFQQNRAWMREKMTGLSAEELRRLRDGLQVLQSAFSTAAAEQPGRQRK